MFFFHCFPILSVARCDSPFSCVWVLYVPIRTKHILYCIHFILWVVQLYRVTIVCDKVYVLYYRLPFGCLRLDSSMTVSAEKLSYLQRETYSTQWTDIKRKWILPSGEGFKNLHLWALSVGRHALHAPTHCPLFLNLRCLVNSFKNICAKSNPSVLSGFMHIITLCNDVWNAAELSVTNMFTLHVNMQRLHFYKMKPIDLHCITCILWWHLLDCIVVFQKVIFGTTLQ